MKGQALVESLFTYILIFLVSFCVIEIARLQSFKALLQVSVNYYAKYIALDEMRLIKQNRLNLDSKKITSNMQIEDEIKTLIVKDLSLLETSLFSFDANTLKLSKHNSWITIEFLAKDTSRSPPGIHIKAQTCLPVLFSSFLNLFARIDKINVGRSVNDNSRERNCLGEFMRSERNRNTSDSIKTPHFWFRIRASGYSPWPSSTQIFYKGLGVPKEIYLIDPHQRQKVLKKLDEVNSEI